MDPTLNIMLLGNSGVGKSASGNTLLGNIAFESKNDFDPVTTAISEVPGQVFDKMINVIDTPGILGSEEMREEIKTRCQQLPTPHLFLVVVKIDRFTREQEKAVEAAMTAIGEQELGNAYMLFTNGDALNITLDEFINRRPDGPLPQLVRRFAGTHQFNNKNRGCDQVKELLQKSGHLRPGDRPSNNRRIMLLGLPGDGKSASGNTILGSDCFHSDCSFSAVTTESELESAQVEGRDVTVVDTPGFTQKSLTPRALYREIVNGIKAAHPGPHAFVIVVKIGRISEANLKLFEMLPKLFGKDAPKYTAILFTYGDELRAQSIEDLIKTETSLTKLVSMCGERYCVFNNRERANRQQVRILLDKIDHMINANENQHCTAEMFYDVQRLSVKIPAEFEKFLKSLTRMLQELDCCRRANYDRIDEED